jgi:tetratricopeptide (TPR) repeat protein/transglutaminase-like putative cysteine protease
MHVRYLRPLFIVLAITTTTARADGPAWPVPRGPARGPAPFTYDKSVQKSLPAGFLDDSPACVLFSGTTNHLLADGTVESTTQELIRLNGRKGIDQLGEYKTITYAPSYETVTLHEARIYKAKGGIQSVNASHVHLRDVNTDHQIYDLSKQLVISFPGLEIGDVMEVYWTTRGKHPEYQGQWFNRYTFGHDKYPVARDEWTIRVPKNKPLHYAIVNGEVPVTLREEGDEKVAHFAAKSLAAPPQGERLPPADERQVQAFASTFDTWDDVQRWERQLICDRCDCPTDAKKIVEDLMRGLTDPTAKARVLAQWVRSNVRYVSTGEKHDYTPHPPARTLSQRYGDCKDTAHLLAVLCRQAGLQAGVVTLGVRGDGQLQESVPSPWGSHALCVVTIDGADHWVDTTAQLIGWDVLPRDDRDRACYVTDEKTIRLTRTPPLPPADNATVQKTAVTVRSDGSVSAVRSAEYRGLAAWNKRDDYVDTPAGERRRLAIADLVDAYPKAKLKDVAFQALDDLDKPLTVTTTFEVTEAFTGEKTREGTLGDTGLWQQLLGITINPERKIAIDAGDPFASVCRYVVDLPPSLRFVQTPAAQRLQSAWGGFKLEVKQDPATPHRLEMVFDTRMTKTRVEPAEFEEFQAFLDSVQASFRTTLKLKATDDPADAPLLEALLAKSPSDVDAATALADLYVAQQKFEDARRVLAAARAAKPDVQRLWELSVAVADGAEDEEELLRAAVDRFKDDSKFSLSLGENLIEQNKFKEARKVLEPLTKVSDAAVKSTALMALAHVCLAQEEPKKALRHLKAAELADATAFGADGWTLFGQTYEALGDRKEAMAAYQKALAKDSVVADILMALIRLSVATGKRDEALGYLRQLTAAADGDAEVFAAAAEGFARLGRFDDALDMAGKAKDADGQMPQPARRAVGLALADRGEPAKAIELLTGPDPDATVLVARMRARFAVGDLAGAADDAAASKTIEEPTAELKAAARQVQALMKRRGDLVKAGGDERAVDRFVCAEHLYEGGTSSDRVTALLNEALAAGPCGPAFGLRALMAVDHGRLVKASPDAEKAIQLAPSDFRGYLARGRIQFERGGDSALPDLAKAVELSKRTDAAALHAYAAALAKAGKRDEAAAAQREAVKLRPDVAEYQEQLAEFVAKK